MNWVQIIKIKNFMGQCLVPSLIIKVKYQYYVVTKKIKLNYLSLSFIKNYPNTLSLFLSIRLKLKVMLVSFYKT